MIRSGVARGTGVVGLTLLLATALAPGAGSAAEEAGGPEAVLQKRLHSLMFACRRCIWGVMVKEPETGRILLDRNATLPFNPASNVKLVTTAAALSRLGPDFRFTTRLLGQREGPVLTTGLYLQGGGDPTLTSATLAEVAWRLKDMGIEEVRGPLYVDSSAHGDGVDPPGFKAFSSSHPYRAGVDALSLNHNVIRIAISPAESAGQPATIAVSPESSYLRIQGRVVTSTRGTRLRAATFFAGPRTGVSVSGRIHAGSETLLFWRRVYHPALFTGHSLRQELEAAGIRVSFAVRKHATPPGTPILLEHRSQSLTRIIQLGNKTSNNLVAEHLFLALGADVFGPPATFDKGRRAVDAYLRNIGVQPGTYRIENGSGLSRRNRIRPADLVRVLETSATDLSLGPDLLASLPVAGRDGTLLRRFEGSPAVGHVRAKTGTLGGVSCLTGYAEYGGRHLVFTFFTGRVRRLPQARRLQVSMAEALVEDLHARWPDEQAPAHATAGGPTLHEPSSSAPVLTAAPGVSPPRPEGGARSGARLER